MLYCSHDLLHGPFHCYQTLTHLLISIQLLQCTCLLSDREYRTTVVSVLIWSSAQSCETSAHCLGMHPPTHINQDACVYIFIFVESVHSVYSGPIRHCAWRMTEKVIDSKRRLTPLLSLWFECEALPMYRVLYPCVVSVPWAEHMVGYLLS